MKLKTQKESINGKTDQIEELVCSKTGYFKIHGGEKRMKKAYRNFGILLKEQILGSLGFKNLKMPK